VIPLDAVDLVLVAARLLDVDPARALDRIDPTALDRALAEPVPRPADPAAFAAALLCGLRSHRPLPTGNDRFALLCVAQLLAHNGWRLDASEPETLARLVRTARRPAGSARRLRSLLHRAPSTSSRRTSMVTRLTDGARRTLDLAQEEARRYCDHVLVPHHLLLGLIREGGNAATALAAVGVDLTTARLAVAELGCSREPSTAPVVPLAPRTRQMLDQAAGEARGLGRAVVDTEHLLLAMLRQQDGYSRKVLEHLGADPAQVREQVHRQATAAAAPDDPASTLRRAVDAAIDAGDYDLAAALRRQLGGPETGAEVARLRALLRANGIDPDASAA
jgi:hypothetical protein